MATPTLKFTGDFKELDRFIAKLAKAPGHMVVLSANLAEETIDLIHEGFATSTDPYGKRWEPLAIRSGQPLRKSGGLMASWQRRFVVAQGFVVVSAKEYAIYHQRGTGIYGPRKQPIKPIKARALRFPGRDGVVFARSVKGSPQRRMVPDKGDLPSRWQKRFVATSHEVLTELFK